MNNDDDIAVRNSADPAQVRRADRQQQDLEAQDLEDLRHALADPIVRRVFWRVFDKAGVFQTVFHPEHALMSHLAGFQDLGRWLMTRCDAAVEGSSLQIVAEARAAAIRAARTRAAGHTRRTADEGVSE